MYHGKCKDTSRSFCIPISYHYRSTCSLVNVKFLPVGSLQGLLEFKKNKTTFYKFAKISSLSNDNYICILLIHYSVQGIHSEPFISPQQVKVLN